MLPASWESFTSFFILGHHLYILVQPVLNQLVLVQQPPLSATTFYNHRCLPSLTNTLRITTTSKHRQPPLTSTVTSNNRQPPYTNTDVHHFLQQPPTTTTRYSNHQPPKTPLNSTAS